MSDTERILLLLQLQADIARANAIGARNALIFVIVALVAFMALAAASAP